MILLLPFPDLQAEAPAAHRSPVTKPSRPKAPSPSKPKGPKPPESHKREAPSRGKGGTSKKGKKESPKKSAGVDEREVPEFEGVALMVPSLGALPN